MKMIATLLSVAALGGAALAFGSDEAQEKSLKSKSVQVSKEEVIAQQLPTYPFDVCIVSAEPLDAMGAPIDWVHEERLVRFCCKSCVKQFKKDPAAGLKKIDEAVIQKQVAGYPLKTCIVSGEPLDSMGGPLDIVHGTRLVRFCCKGCLKSLKKDPAKLMKQLDEAYIEAQLASYPLDKCFLSGEPLEDSAKNFLYGNRLVRTCCGRCAKAFKKDPEKHLATLDKLSKMADKKGI